MSIALRPYQREIKEGIHAAWGRGAKNVLGVAPTGAGKTVLFADILQEHDGPACAIAHRRELVGQMSTTLARLGVRHRIISPLSVIREIVQLHMRAVGASYHDSSSRVAVAGVDTLARRDDLGWAERVTLWVCDEGHHLLRSNKWGKGLARFPNARGLGVTATPVRADGRGLGRHADGVMDAMVTGPETRDLIGAGYLSDYRIFAPASDINLAAVPVSDTTGDYNPAALRDAAAKSHITGDLVTNYLRIAKGKRGLAFCVSVELAADTAARFRAAGVRAETVSAETPDLVRAEILARFGRGDLDVLTNVDLFGEGFDVPACEVVMMGRPTESFGLYRQQVGRALRPLEGKTHAILIDHVGNVLRHGLPDAYRGWTLDRRERRSRTASDDTPMLRVCAECLGVYERFRRECPYCGHVPIPASRSAPEFVDGDLLELDPAVLARLRGEAVRPVVVPYGASPIVVNSIHARHRERNQALAALREAIAWWAGWQVSLGRDDHESYRRFYLQFGVDVATAQTLDRKDMDALAIRVDETMVAAGVRLREEAAA